MNLRLKTITFLSLLGLNSFAPAMDAEKKEEAAITYPKQKIEAALIKTDIFPKALTPLVAEYAEPMHQGYIFIVPSKAAKVYAFIDGYLEKYRKDFPELGANLNKESVMVYCWVSSFPGSLDWNVPSDAKPWHAHLCPHLPQKSGGMNFPHQFPAAVLRDLKEDDTTQIRVQGVLFALKCSQLTHRYGHNFLTKQPRRFEQVFAEATAGLLEEPKQKNRADEEDED